MIQLSHLKRLLPLALAALSPLHTTSVPASPHGVVELQPDGSKTPALYIQGDHRVNYMTDENSYTVIRDEEGWYVYADRDETSGELFPTDMLLGVANPELSGLEQDLRPAPRSRLLREIDQETENKVERQRSGLRGDRKKEIKITRRTQVQDQEALASGAKVMKNVVLLMRFSDHAKRPLPSEDDIDVLMNHNGHVPNVLPTGSVADVYRKNSFGNLILQSDVLEWVTISRTEQQCADGVNGYSDQLVLCIREALDIYAQNGVDFSQWDVDRDGEFDGITVLHSGYGSEWGFSDCYGQQMKDRIWSHKWTMPTRLHWTSPNTKRPITFNKYHITSALWGRCGTEISRIGAIAHETGHFIDLPDLYDVDGSGYGSGNYDMMANMWGWKNDQYYPPIMSCWTKVQAGWIQPIEIEKSGSYSLPAAAEYPMCFKISKGFPDKEYLLVENRYATSYDIMMPGQGGLAIWHVDEKANLNVEGHPDQNNYPENGKHYKVSLLQADGEFNLEKKVNRGDYGDLYREGGRVRSSGTYPNTQSYQHGEVSDTNIEISNISAPGTLMSFKVIFLDEKKVNSVQSDQGSDSNIFNPVVTTGNSDSGIFTPIETENNSSPDEDSENVTVEQETEEEESNEQYIEWEENNEEIEIEEEEEVEWETVLDTELVIEDPEPEKCIDDPNFFIKKEKQNCEWVAKKNQCDKCEDGLCARDYCKLSCGLCNSD